MAIPAFISRMLEPDEFDRTHPHLTAQIPLPHDGDTVGRGLYPDTIDLRVWPSEDYTRWHACVSASCGFVFHASDTEQVCAVARLVEQHRRDCGCNAFAGLLGKYQHRIPAWRRLDDLSTWMRENSLRDVISPEAAAEHWTFIKPKWIAEAVLRLGIPPGLVDEFNDADARRQWAWFKSSCAEPRLVARQFRPPWDRPADVP